MSSPPAPSPVVAVAFVSREDEGGGPLYFKTFAGAPSAPSALGANDEATRIMLAAYASIDILEEKVHAQNAAAAAVAAGQAPAPPPEAPPLRDPFLGLLMPADDYKLFGYQTPTGVRIVVVVRDVLLREDRVRELFRALHRLYADAACSPFAPAGYAHGAGGGARIASPAFEEAVTRLCESADILYRGPIPL